MPKITFISDGGEATIVDATTGNTLMQTAVDNSVEGIDADCGGACACATCHVYIDSNFRNTTGKPESMEASMLEFVENFKEGSRLSCQITITDDMHLMQVTMPENQ